VGPTNFVNAATISAPANAAITSKRRATIATRSAIAEITPRSNPIVPATMISWVSPPSKMATPIASRQSAGISHKVLRPGQRRSILLTSALASR
jgi:hypothetical protein